MFSSSTPPPPPPFLDKEIVQELQDDTEKVVSPFEPSPQFKPLDDSIGDTEKKLVETISSIRIPKINREWKKCISEIEKVIDLKPTDKEYNNFSARKRIEQYKDRLGKDLYECKINQKKKEENDKELEKLKRKKAQDDFEKRFEKKYNLQPNVIQSSQQPSQPSQQSFQPSQPQQMSEQSQAQQSFQQPQQISEQQESSQPPQQDDKKDEKKGFFSRIFGDSSEDEDSEDELDKVNQENDLLEKKEEIVDSINMYLKSQDPALSQNIDIRDIKGIDNLLEQYEDLVNNHEKLTDVFQKYKEKQKVNNVKTDHLINEQEETIDNLTSVIVKLEKKLKTYKNNAEKKFIAQGELHEESLKKKDSESKRKLKQKDNDFLKKLKQKDNESREIHKYMQSL